jgi:hypothetical protein
VAGDEGIVLRVRICEDAAARLRALNDPTLTPLIRDIDALAEKLRALRLNAPPSANRPAKAS